MSALLVPLSKRSVRFIKLCGYVIRVVILLDVDDADSLSRRSASLCDELLPLLSTFASSQFRGGAFSPVDGDSTSITTVTESLTVKLTLRNLLAGITLLTIKGRGRGGVLLPEAAAQFEIVAYIVDRKAAAARTTAALGLGGVAASGGATGGGGKKTTAPAPAAATTTTTTSIKRAKVKTTIVL